MDAVAITEVKVRWWTVSGSANGLPDASTCNAVMPAKARRYPGKVLKRFHGLTRCGSASFFLGVITANAGIKAAKN
jgi:hypothetical protein